MLSILIPVYNYDVRELVLGLVDQIKKIDKPIRIQILNDGSEDKWQAHLDELALLQEVSLHSLPINKGRVEARKKLIGLAKYDHLLFIDCDAKLIGDKFILNYLNNITASSVIVGGHVYQTKRPSKEYLLHWKYGREVEVRPISDRMKHPYQSFSTFNFCIPKKIFKNYLTDLEVQGYGHEDTLMGHILSNNNIPIQHVENPLLHAGLKDTGQFLRDTKSSIENALELANQYPNIEIKLIRYAYRIKALGLKPFVLGLINMTNNRITKNLNSDNPSLKLLQLYKLKYLLSLNP